MTPSHTGHNSIFHHLGLLPVTVHSGPLGTEATHLRSSICSPCKTLVNGKVNLKVSSNFSIVTANYQFPLSREEFRRALKQGLGRALEFVEKHGLEDYRDVVLNSCLRSPVYDVQCEQGRAEWLASFFEGTPDWLTEPLYLKLCQLNPEEERSWNQWTSLALLLAQRGATDARRALYRGFRILDDGEIVAAREIISLDGAPGLLWTAEKLDKAAQLERSTFLGLLDYFDDVHGEGEGLKVVRASANSRLQGFLRRIERPEPKWKTGTSSPLTPLTAPEALARLTPYALQQWTKKASPDVVAFIAGQLNETRDPEILEKILFCFMNTGLPSFDPVLLRLSDYPYGEVARRARWVMSHHQHSEIREKTLLWLNSHQLLDGRLRALKGVLQARDIALIESAVAEALPSLGDDEKHDLLSDVLYLACQHSEIDMTRLLVLCYEHTPCTQTRREAVELMYSQNRLPDWIAHEGQWDCSESIRNLVGRI